LSEKEQERSESRNEEKESKQKGSDKLANSEKEGEAKSDEKKSEDGEKKEIPEINRMNPPGRTKTVKNQTGTRVKRAKNRTKKRTDPRNHHSTNGPLSSLP
jgi:hypothetical protein